MLMLSCFSCIRLFEALRPVAHQAPLFMRFSRQEYWSGMPCPSPRDLPDPGIKLTSPASPVLQVDSLPTEPPLNLIKLLFYLMASPIEAGLSGVNEGHYTADGCVGSWPVEHVRKYDFLVFNQWPCVAACSRSSVEICRMSRCILFSKLQEENVLNRHCRDCIATSLFFKMDMTLGISLVE